MKRRYLGCDVNGNYREQFQSVTAKHVSHRWQKTKQERTQNGSQQAALADSIRRLRQTKFPKALFKGLKLALGQTQVSGIKAILADAQRLKNPPAPHVFAELALYIVCASGAPIAAIERAARQIANKPPMSKYGIIANIHVIRSDDSEHFRAIPVRKRRFVYTEGTTHYYADDIRQRDWLSAVPQSWKRIPPVVCNVGVRQTLVRTWAPTTDST
jgi:hypothetical protein